MSEVPYSFNDFSSRAQKVLQVATDEDEPSLERIAKLSMQKVACIRGCGKTTLHEIARKLTDYGIKSRYRWEKERAYSVSKEVKKSGNTLNRRWMYGNN